jgi:polyisoprenyl-teichoic acid--peptidoglycan teichoic acid transferase
VIRRGTRGRGQRSTPAAPARPAAEEPTTPRAPYAPSVTTRVEKRRARQRRRLGVGGVLLVLLLIAGVVTAGILLRNAVTKDEEPTDRPRTQVTLLFQVKAADGKSAAAALMAHDPADGSASIAFVPATLRVLATGIGSRVPFEQTLLLGGPRASRSGVQNLLGVLVDHDWTLTPAGLAALVDRVGRIEVTVDTDVVQDVGGGRQVTLVQAGTQELDGQRAAAFATYVGAGEASLAALPRLQEVLDGILEALPDADAQLATVVSSLGRDSTSTLDGPRLAAFLRSMAAAQAEDDLQVATLPVAPIDAGAGRTQYTLDEVQALELVRSTLSASVPPGRFDGDNRVVLLNGVGRAGFTSTAQTRLSDAGYEIVKVGNANRFNYQKSVVLVRDGTQASTELGRKVATALRLPTSAVQIYGRETTASDVIVILGADYKP